MPRHSSVSHAELAVEVAIIAVDVDLKMFYFVLELQCLNTTKEDMS